MEIKDYKVIKKVKYNSSKYYIRIKRKLFGMIPYWSVMRDSHLSDEFSFFKYVPEFIIISLLLLFIDVRYSIIDCICLDVGVIILIFGLSFVYLVGHLGYSKISKCVYSRDDSDTIKDFAEENINKFNEMNSKKNKTNEVVYSKSEKDNKYYNIKIPKFNFKKFLY